MAGRRLDLCSMQKFLCAASSERSNLKGDHVSGGDGVLVVAITWQIRSLGQVGLVVVVVIVLVQAR